MNTRQSDASRASIITLVFTLVVDADDGVEGAAVATEAEVGVSLLGRVDAGAALGTSRLLNLLERLTFGRRVVGRLAFPAVVGTGLVEEGSC
jgi:hypothetical protein